MSADSRSIARSSAVMAIGTVLSRLTGVLRTAAIVAVIGFGPFSDAYTIANVIPNIVYTIILGGAITAVFLPQIMRAMRQDADGGNRYTNTLLTAVGLLLLVLALAAFVLAPALIDIYGPSDWPADVKATAVLFARFLLPQIFLYGVFAMLQQVLNARDHFAMPMYAPIANNLVVIGVSAFLLFSYRSELENGLTRSETIILGLGTTGGLLVQTLLLIPMVYAVGFRFRLNFGFRKANLGKPMKLALWSIGFVAVNQISYIAITRLSASANVSATSDGLTSVGFTSFQNAQLLFLLPYAVVTVSLVTALFPRLSKAANNQDAKDTRAHLDLGLTGILVTLLPASVLLYIAAPLLTITLFARGASSVDEALATGQIVQAFCFGILPFSIFYLLLRVFYADEDTATPFWLNLVLNVTVLASAVALYIYLPLGAKVTGLAAAMSASYLVIVVITALIVRRKVGGLHLAGLLSITWKSLIASALAALTCWLILRTVAPDNSQDFARNLIALTLGGLASGAILLVTWRLLGVKNLATLIRPKDSPTRNT